MVLIVGVVDGSTAWCKTRVEESEREGGGGVERYVFSWGNGKPGDAEQGRDTMKGSGAVRLSAPRPPHVPVQGSGGD
jgi:hypothetical protein